MTDLPVSAIKIGERRREDMGDIEGLAASIDAHGLFHAVVVDDDGNLIAGHRRLLACQLLGWTMIPTRSLGELTESEMREIELEENLKRKDLTSYEVSKTLTALAETVAEVLREEGEFSANLAENSPKTPGRPMKVDAQDRVAERINIPQRTLSHAGQHVETADAYPFMRAPDWKQDHVLEARQHLASLPEEERAPAAALVSQPGVPPQEAVKILGHLRHSEPDDRQEIYRKAESSDPREVSASLTIPTGRPAMPDPRVIGLASWLRDIAGWNRGIDDEFAAEFAAFVPQFEDLKRRIKEARPA